MPARPRARQCGGKAPGGSPGKITQYQYDATRKLTRATDTLRSIEYGYDETGQGQSRAWNYSYDAIDRLQSADRSDGAQYDYVLDKGDNITGIIDPSGSRAWGNKIAQAPYKFDANGNWTEDERHTYRWDAENRLIQIGYKTDPQKSTEFKYDGQGRRVAITEKAGSTEKETCYTWCGDTICQARDGNDQPIAYYFDEGTFRPEVNTPVSKLQGEREYYAKDHLGSVRDVLDQAGNVTASYDYDPYGKLTNSPVKQPSLPADQQAIARAAIEKLESKAGDWIAKYGKGSVNRKFPGQFRDKTGAEILKLSRSGDKDAKTAWKLINDSRFGK